MKNRKMVCLFMTTALLASLTACGNKPAESTKNSTDDQNQADAGNVSLNFIVQEVDYEHVKEAMQPYLDEHKDVEVELVKVADFTAMNQKVLASHQANDDYDLIFVNHVDALAFSKAGIKYVYGKRWY